MTKPWPTAPSGDRRLAGQDAGTRLEVEASVEPSAGDRVDDVERRPDGALRVVLVRHRRAPDRHHGVADELLHDAAVALNGLAGPSK